MARAKGKVSLLIIILINSTAFLAQSGASQTQEQSAVPTNVTIPAGTLAKVELLEPVSSKLNEVGDEISAVLNSSILVDGYVALKRGTEIRGRITQISEAKRPQRQASMTIVFDRFITPEGEREIETRLKAIDDYANEDKLNPNDEGKVNAGHSGGRTVDNAIKGGTLGSIVGLPIILTSGAAGASAPLGGVLGGVLLTKGKEIKLEPGTVFRIEIAKPVTVPVVNSVEDPVRPFEWRSGRRAGLRGPTNNP